jgi:hypothetical protein
MVKKKVRQNSVYDTYSLATHTISSTFTCPDVPNARILVPQPTTDDTNMYRLHLKSQDIVRCHSSDDNVQPFSCKRFTF